MAKSLDSLREEETIILWNASDEPATLWTASAKVRKEWLSYGFPVVPVGGGFGCVVAVDRISYKPVKK